MTMAVRRLPKLMIATLVIALACAACVVEEPVIETTSDAAGQSTSPSSEPQPTAPPAQFEPTVESIPPTVAPLPTQTPTPTVPPTAVPPIGPTPLPTSDPVDEFAPIVVEPGLVVVPVRNASFRLSAAHPVLQLGGHTLIYIDDDQMAEVDIFTPVAGRDAQPFGSYDALINYVTSDSAFASLTELTPVSIAGLSTRVFEGPAESVDRAFVTDLAVADDVMFGWLPPARMRLWIIDHPDGPVIVSAESLENPGRYSDAVRLATEVLSTIDFG